MKNGLSMSRPFLLFVIVIIRQNKKGRRLSPPPSKPSLQMVSNELNIDTIEVTNT